MLKWRCSSDCKTLIAVLWVTVWFWGWSRHAAFPRPCSQLKSGPELEHGNGQQLFLRNTCPAAVAVQWTRGPEHLHWRPWSVWKGLQPQSTQTLRRPRCARSSGIPVGSLDCHSSAVLTWSKLHLQPGVFGSKLHLLSGVLGQL